MKKKFQRETFFNEKGEKNLFRDSFHKLLLQF